jgi:hypothetical protein
MNQGYRRAFVRVQVADVLGDTAIREKERSGMPRHMLRPQKAGTMVASFTRPKAFESG